MISRNHTIDILRTVAVLYIVGYWHLCNYISDFPGYANQYTEGIKDVILGIFTFTSGYLLAGRPLQLVVTDVMSFYRRRLARIYPLYVVALLLFRWVGLMDDSTTLKGALLVSMLIPPAPPTLWFITMIMGFYLIAPLLIHFTARPFILLLISIVILFILICFSTLIHGIDLRLLLYFPTFVAGIMVAGNNRILQSVRNNKLILALFIIPAFWLFHGGSEYSLAGVAALIPLVIIGTLALFVYVEYYASHWQNSVVLFISYSSFCMYLFHRLIYQYIKSVYMPTNLILQIVYMLGVGLVVTTILSYAIQSLYDRSRVDS